MARFTSADDNRQSYTSRSPTSKSTSKSTSKTTTSSGGGGGQNSNYNQYTAYTPAQVKSGKAKVAKDIAKDNATAFNNYKYTTPKFTPSLLAKGLDALGISEKTFNVNKAYYEKNVIGKNNFTKSIDSYKDYMSKRGSGKIDAMGRAISGGGNGGNTQPGITKNIGGRTIQTTAPTEAEVSQSEAANADGAALKVKKRGRSASIMTGPKGVTKTSTDYSLGKKSLLGRV
jgi:hypothetical protein